MTKSYQEQCLDFIKEAVTHGKREGVDKLTVTWQQHGGSAGTLNHALTVTYKGNDEKSA